LLYTLPVSLFGISISSAALPSIAADAQASDALERVRARVAGNAARIAYFTIPSAVCFLALGDVLAATLLQTGRFTASDSQYVWAILAGSAVGLVAATTSRLYGVAHYALGDTRTPLRFTIARLALATGLGYVAAVWLPGWVGLEPRWGAAGLTASAGVAGWIELLLLRRSLRARVGEVSPTAAYLTRVWIAAGLAGALSRAARWALPALPPLVVGALVLPLFGVLFLGISRAAGVPFAGRSESL
jgi:putative peptidoglycan lipid II flippase